MDYKECCDRLGDKLAQSGPLVGPEALALLETCIDALRARTADGRLDEAALIEHLPKLRIAIRTVWNHDKLLAVSLENRIIAIMEEERSRRTDAAGQTTDAPDGDSQ